MESIAWRQVETGRSAQFSGEWCRAKVQVRDRAGRSEYQGVCRAMKLPHAIASLKLKGRGPRQSLAGVLGRDERECVVPKGSRLYSPRGSNTRSVSFASPSRLNRGGWSHRDGQSGNSHRSCDSDSWRARHHFFRWNSGCHDGRLTY